MASRSSRSEAILAVLLALALAVGMLLWLYHPVVPRSLLGWVILIAIGIPTWFLLESLGARVLSARVFSNLGRPARIALAIPVLVVLLILAAYVIRLGQEVIAGS
jgi:hypothetical protein